MINNTRTTSGLPGSQSVSHHGSAYLTHGIPVPSRRFGHRAIVGHGPGVFDKKGSGILVRLFMILACISFFNGRVMALDAIDNTNESSPVSSEGIIYRIDNLTRLMHSMDELSKEIVETRNELESPSGKGREQLLNDRLTRLNQKLFEMEENFNQLASEVSLKDMNIHQGDDFDWNQELKTILGPLIRELQRATSRPREIEKHRSDIEGYDQQLSLIIQAMSHIQKLIDAPDCPSTLKNKLNQSLSAWVNRENEILTLRNIARLQLNKISDEDESLSDTLKKLPRIFFKSHGSNLILSILAFCILAFILFRAHRIIRKFSPLHKTEQSFYSRVFDLCYGFVSLVLCGATLLGVLYALSDWVLLSLILVFMLGIVWTSKEALPRIWNQARLILNLGPVREGELVIYNGIPYIIKTINIYTSLSNPALPNTRIRLPLADLLDMRSRPSMPDEPWFPTRIHEWILLDEEYPAKVIVQTPETVVIERIGGARISYTALDFIATNPMNLSSGFRIKVLFGLDYNLQGIITDTVPEIMRRTIEEELFKSGFREQLSLIKSNFKQAASSSLDIEICIDFSGSAARDYVHIKRLIQKACVEACNRENWVIPFNQLTVHVDPGKHS